MGITTIIVVGAIGISLYAIGKARSYRLKEREKSREIDYYRNILQDMDLRGRRVEGRLIY